MKTIIAIKGHAIRHKEVIEILEMLGGKNEQGHCGHNPKVAYYISHDKNTILCNCAPNIYPNIYKCVDYTLEEFIEKYPYKVGDKVIVTGLPEYPKSINFMKWFDGDIHYSFDNETWFLPSALKPYKEETIETITIDDFKANTKEWLIDKLYGMIISKAIKTIGDIHEELHKPQYPKTYVECAKILECFSALHIDGYKNVLFEKLQELLICRDAYWKITGDWMGLGKPWEPDWLDTSTQKYCIYYVGDEIKKQPMLEVHHFLAFPTVEMRNVFYENFKELIESCKDFL